MAAMFCECDVGGQTAAASIVLSHTDEEKPDEIFHNSEAD